MLLHHAMMERFVLLEEQLLMKAELNFVTRISGERFAETDGLWLMHELFVGSLATLL